MNCAEFQVELQHRLDVGLTLDDERFREHCQMCFACGEAWEGARLLSDAIVAWRGQVPDVDLAEAVVAAYAQSTSQAPADFPMGAMQGHVTPGAGRNEKLDSAFRRTVRRGISRRSKAVLAAAACLVSVAVGLTLLSPGGTERSSSSGVEVVSPSTPASGASAVPRTEVALFNQAGVAYDSLARSAVGALEEFALIVIPIQLSEAPVEHGAEHWTESLQDGLQPLQKGIDDALNFLRETGDSSRNTRT